MDEVNDIPSFVMILTFDYSPSVNEPSDGQRFESTAKEFAILIMPDGARTQDLLNTRGVRDAISSNGEEWYRYAKNIRGREIKNGDIRVVIGVDKVSSWGMAASACNSGRAVSYVFKHDSVNAHKWDCTGESGRTGPQSREIRDLIEDGAIPQNQCVFVRTINFSLSKKMWKNISSEVLEELDSGSGSFTDRDSISSYRGEGRTTSGPGAGGSPSVNFDPVGSRVGHSILLFNSPYIQIQVDHPSAAIHKYLHEKVTRICIRISRSA
jgi:hypothetical protein